MTDETPTRKVYIEAPSGERFEADVPLDAKLSKVAADFFDAQGWPTTDRRGRGQRVVVELVNPVNPDDTKRLNGDLEMDQSGVREGDTLRIFPESIAGAVDYNARTRALISDHNDLLALCERNTNITFTANRTHAPDRYEITFRYPSFTEYAPGMKEPLQADTHQAEITLPADYPRRAPFITWLTPIFHPNIQQPDGAVCLGALMDRYLPGMGLARLVNMLAEMIQWRNYDATNAFNKEAAQWAANTEHWPEIHAIGGHPLQGPIGEFLAAVERQSQPPIQFRRLAPGA